MDAYTGEIRIFAGNFAPEGWAFCQGQLLNISSYEQLYQLLGTTYGGDGQTTFGLPNLQGSVPISQGQGTGLSSYSLGQTQGFATVTLTSNQLPAHDHGGKLLADSRPGNQRAIAGNIPALEGTGQNAFFAPAPRTGAMASSALSIVGGSQPHENMPPYQVLNFIIALDATFPTRS